MKRKIFFGKVDYLNNGRRNCPVEIEIELREQGGQEILRRDPQTNQYIPTGEYTPKYLEFSACGIIWNHKHTDCYTAGQCLDTINEYIKSPLFKEIYHYWKLYHLNGMHAGTPEQEKAIEEWKQAGNKYDYTAVCDYLKSINLYEVNHNGKPYRYGTAWLHQDIPTEDLERIKTIICGEPTTDEEIPQF